MATPADVLRSLSRVDPTRPRITWYESPGGARVELSGKTLDNWLSKAANLMLEEFDIGSGSRVVLDMPPTHWRATYWATATWALGAQLVLHASAEGPGITDPAAADAAAADLVITFDALRYPAGIPLVAVTPAPLARAHPTPLPDGVLDEARQLAGYGDVFVPAFDPAATDLALTDGDTKFDYASLVPPSVTSPSRRRVWVPADTDGVTAVRTMLGAWAEGSGVVVVPRQPHEAVLRILRSEGVPLPDSRTGD